jgi:asparaginyl-tRNA synthetase
MEKLKRTKVKELLHSEPGKEVLAKGWVRTKRGNKQVKFIALNDGSTINNIQVVANAEIFDEETLKKITTGSSIGVVGNLVASIGSGQAVEIQAKEITVYGECDPLTYPLQKKDTSLEFLRSVAHLRLRTNTFGAVLRIRNAMAFAIHKYFNERGFVYLNTPLITESDAEGAGDMFQVTTLDLNNIPDSQRENRLQQGLLRKEDLSYCERTARRGTWSNCCRRNLHFRPYFPCREFKYAKAPWPSSG